MSRLLKSVTIVKSASQAPSEPMAPTVQSIKPPQLAQIGPKPASWHAEKIWKVEAVLKYLRSQKSETGLARILE
jgi:hypothetical protein